MFLSEGAFFFFIESLSMIKNNLCYNNIENVLVKMEVQSEKTTD